MHPQTLRQYDRLGLVQPGRAAGGGRRYSARDVALLREVQRLSQDDGVNLAGIKRIIELEQLVDELQQRVAELEAAAGRRRTRGSPQLEAVGRTRGGTWCRPDARRPRWSSGARVARPIRTERVVNAGMHSR